MAEKDVLEPVSALELLAQHTQRFSFGCPVLDECAGGGIPLCGITEVGPHICLQLRCRGDAREEAVTARVRINCAAYKCTLSRQIAGESSAGKTQLCLQLLLQAQLPQEYGGLDSAALYVSTEGEPPMKRLQELALHFVVALATPLRNQAGRALTRAVLSAATEDGCETRMCSPTCLLTACWS